MGKQISLDGIRMHVVSTANAGVVHAETLFIFTQEGSVVSASYSGGKVRLGYLVGVISAEGLRFRYAQLDVEGHLDGGRIRLFEHFEWESREGSGTNVFEELLID